MPPALATADVGIAMGAAGSDVAIETADVALLGEDLKHLPQMIGHARRAGAIMRQNLALSGAILVTLVPLAAFGVLGDDRAPIGGRSTSTRYAARLPCAAFC